MRLCFKFYLTGPSRSMVFVIICKYQIFCSPCYEEKEEVKGEEVEEEKVKKMVRGEMVLWTLRNMDKE